LVLSVAKPEGESRRAATLQAARGGGRDAARSPGAATTPDAIDEQHLLRRQRSGVDQRGVVLEDVELAPVDRAADNAPRGRVEVRQIGRDLADFAIERYGQLIGGYRHRAHGCSAR